ncbi:STT3 domain-containing protein [Thermococcus sp. 2319x1]|uniref:STT3 domain-containing protein n=1 Tax=Thermococcus sp. 2319x1 TaxID=1674923 RepID=UPI001583152B|nr:STT3 domain-containing protein [Thermococcus sp. 2319x1]
MDFGRMLKPKAALPLITVIALIFRLVPLRFKYMLGYDPYFHLAYIEEALRAGEWFNFLSIAGGPWGYQVRTFHPLGLWMTPAYVYKILKVFGISLYNAFRITPVIFGVLTIVFFYLALLKLYDKKRAFFASLFLALSYGHVFRSMANYYRGDNYMLFWYSIALFGISLAIEKKHPRWRYKRLIFYIIPALASGFASIFWQAYYPIFVFLLANALFLGVGAFILGKDRYILDGIVLTLSTALGAFVANFLGGKFGYGMLGYNEWLGKKVAEKLSLELNTIKDAYLLFHLKYLAPIALLALLALLVLSRAVKNKKQRALMVAVLGTVGIYLLFARFGALKELSTGFGIFREAPIMETRPSTFDDLWNAFALGIFLTPPFLLRFRSPKVQDFMLLGLILPGLYMIKTWTRFLFIGSMGVALMAGIGLWELYEILPKFEGRKGLALALGLLVVVPGANAAFGFERVVKEKPFMNEHWERALVWLRENSNENDVVLAWWDYGHWVTYYARRSPVAQGSPDTAVALYYLGKLDENWAMGLGVDYVIVSYYDFFKFGAIVDTAKRHPKYNVTGQYGMVVLPMVSSLGAFVFQRENYRVVAKPGERWNILVNVDGQAFTPREVYVEYKGGIVEPNLKYSNSDAYLYINLDYGYAVLMNGEAFNTTLAKLFIRPGEPYELVYSDGVVKILKLKHPNVRVEGRDGKIVLRFENATGTGLGIYGFLDNGTKVFEEWYNVKGMEEFELPAVNGTVIRYAYAEGKKIVDRGVFRCTEAKCVKK